MNSQYDLTSLAQEIERQEAAKKDYLVSTNALLMMGDDRTIGVQGQGEYGITDYAHGQIASKLGIPKAYYDFMTAVPGLRAHNVNSWLHHKPEKKMVRTLEGKARAFLSDRYRPLDNFLIMQAFLPAIQGKEVKIRANALSESRLYMQVSFPQLRAEVKPGDVVEAGVILTNSEVGAGAVDVKSMVWRLVCSNGAIRESLLRKYHVGKKIDTENEDMYDLYKNDTITAEIEAYRLKMRDVIDFALTEAHFVGVVEKMKNAIEDKITGTVTATVENVTKRFNLPESSKDKMVENIIREGNENRYGIFNSITALAHDIESPDKQYEYEKLGSKILDLTDREWRELAA